MYKRPEGKCTEAVQIRTVVVEGGRIRREKDLGREEMSEHRRRGQQGEENAIYSVYTVDTVDG